MTKLKFVDNIWYILYEGFKIYFKYIWQFAKYMLFPVFGQVFGIVWILGFTTWFAISVPFLLAKFNAFNNVMIVLVSVLLISLPGFIIFVKAFWDYLVAYGALNSMTSGILTTGKLYDIDAHNQTVTSRSLQFIGILLVISCFILIAINPLFWILGMIFFIYFILVFQVFSFEDDSSVFGCFKKSLILIKGNFARTFCIFIILGIILYFLNFGVSIFLDFIKITMPLKSLFETFAMMLPLNAFNNILAYIKLPLITALMLANVILSFFISFIVAGLTLPLRSICWSLWYKNLIEKEVVKK